jgi:hypothetical protein
MLLPVCLSQVDLERVIELTEVIDQLDSINELIYLLAKPTHYST